MGFLNKMGFRKAEQKELTTLDESSPQPKERRSGTTLTGKAIAAGTASTVAMSGMANAQDLNKPPIPNTDTPPSREYHEKKPGNAVDYYREQGLLSGAATKKVSDAIEEAAKAQREEADKKIKQNTLEYNKVYDDTDESRPDPNNPPLGYKTIYAPDGTFSFVPKTGKDYKNQGAIIDDRATQNPYTKNQTPSLKITPEYTKHKPEKSTNSKIPNPQNTEGINDDSKQSKTPPVMENAHIPTNGKNIKLANSFSDTDYQWENLETPNTTPNKFQSPAYHKKNTDDINWENLYKDNGVIDDETPKPNTAPEQQLQEGIPQEYPQEETPKQSLSNKDTGLKKINTHYTKDKPTKEQENLKKPKSKEINPSQRQEKQRKIGEKSDIVMTAEQETIFEKSHSRGFTALMEGLKSMEGKLTIEQISLLMGVLASSLSAAQDGQTATVDEVYKDLNPNSKYADSLPQSEAEKFEAGQLYIKYLKENEINSRENKPTQTLQEFAQGLDLDENSYKSLKEAEKRFKKPMLKKMTGVANLSKKLPGQKQSTVKPLNLNPRFGSLPKANASNPFETPQTTLTSNNSYFNNNSSIKASSAHGTVEIPGGNYESIDISPDN